MSLLTVCFYFFVLISVSKTRADFTDVNELVEESAYVISQYSTYEAPTNNDAYFENMTSTASLGKLLFLH